MMRNHQAKEVLSTLLAAALLAVALSTCKAGGAASPFTVLDDDAAVLREQFNKDIGKTRIVMLVAPT